VCSLNPELVSGFHRKNPAVKIGKPIVTHGTKNLNSDE
jgi:hypothetical protein